MVGLRHLRPNGLLVACLSLVVVTSNIVTLSTAFANTSPVASNTGSGVSSNQATPVAAQVARISGVTQVLLTSRTPIELVLHASRDFSPSLFVNVGSLSRPIQSKPGQWRFIYQPPKEKYPQIALIAARDASGQRLAVHHIELLGSPKVKVRSEPFVSVHVHVRGRVFGPVKTNGRGQGYLRIEVPPGENVAETRGTDSHGNTTSSSLPLDVPPFNRHLLVCSDTGEDVFLLSVTPQNELSSELDIALYASHGSPPDLQMVQPGLFHTRWQLDTTDHTKTTVEMRAELVLGSSVVSQCSAPTPVPEAPIPAPPTIQIPQTNWRLGLRAGIGSNGARVAGPYISARFARTTLDALPGLVVAAEVGAYTSTDTSDTIDGNEVVINFTGAPLVVRTGYEHSWDKFIVQGTAGLGSVLSRVSIRTAGTEQLVNDVSWLSGGSLTGGYRVGPGHVLVEAGYWWASFNNQNISGNVMGLNSTVGYFFAL